MLKRLSVSNSINSNAVLGLILIGHLAIKLLSISSQCIWGDEAFSIFYSQQSLSELTERLTVDTNAPLYFYFLHFWIKLFGISEFAVKSLSILFSTMAAYFIYRIADRIQGIGMAITVSLFFLFSNLHFEYSHQVRGYSLICLEVSASFYFLLHYVQNWRIREIIWVCIINTLIAYTHYIAILTVVVQFGVIWFFKPDKANIKRVFLAYFTSFLLFCPYILVLLNNVPDDNFWLQKPGWIEFKYVVFKLAGNDHIFWFLFIPFTLAPFLLAKRIRPHIFKPELDSRLVLLFTCWFFVPIFIDFLLSLWKPVFLMRYLLSGSIGFLLGLTYLIWNLKFSRNIRLVVSGIYVGMFLAHFTTVYPPGEDWKGIAELLKSTDEDSTATFICASYKIRDLAYYYDRESFARDYKDIYESQRKKQVYAIADEKDFSEIMENNTFNKIHLILSHSEMSDPRHTIEAYLEQHEYVKCDEYGTGFNDRLLIYRPTSKPCYKLTELNKSEVENNCYTWIKTEYLNELNNSATTEYRLNTSLPRICDKKGAAFKKSVDGVLGYHINKTEEFSPCLKIKLPVDVIKVSYTADVAGHESNEAVLALVVESGEDMVFYKTHYLNGMLKRDSPGIFDFSSTIPANLPEDRVIKVYLWNPGKDDAILTNLSVRFWKSVH